MILLRALARVVGMLLMLALALCCLGLALYCLDGLIGLGSARPDRLLHLVAFREHVGRFLDQTATPGDTARLALAGGVLAAVLGLVVLLGLLHSPRERRAILDSGEDGTLGVQARPLRAMVQALAEQADGATGVRRPSLSLSRRGRRGRLTLQVAHTPASDRETVRGAVTHQIEPLSGPLRLRARVRVRDASGAERVQ